MIVIDDSYDGVMASTITHHQLDSMAWTIDRQGIDAVPASVLRELGFVARDAGVRAGLTDLLVDETAPAVVRDRAFGVVASAIGRLLRRDEPIATETEITPDRVACAA